MEKSRGTAGLALCGSCGNHIKASISPCPFCGSVAGQGAKEVAVLPSSQGWRRKTGALTMSLLGLATFAACMAPPAPAYGLPIEGLPEKTTEQTADASTDTPPAPAYGIPAEMPQESTPADGSVDATPAPAYGIPPSP